MIDAGAILARTIAIAFINIDLTVGALKARITFTCIGTNSVIAGAMLAAGITLTLIDVNLTVLANNSWHTNALIATGIFKAKGLTEHARQVHDPTELIECGIGAFQATAIVLARITLTLIDVLFTILALVAAMALAEIVLNLVYAFGPVRAGIRHTFINVQLTVLALVSCPTAVTVKATQFIYAESIVLTWRRDTIINVNVTYTSCHTRYAGACEIVNHIDASGAIRARIADALIDVNLAVVALVTWFAVTFIGIDLVVACGTVETGMTETLVHIRVTMNSGKTGCTVTFVGSLFVFADAIATDIWLLDTFIHIIGAIPSRPATLTLALIVSIGKI